MRKRFRLGRVEDLPVVLFVAGGLLMSNGCARNPVSGAPEVVLVSAEQEKQIGAEEAKEVEEQVGLLEGHPFAPYFAELGRRLAAQSPRQDVSYQFNIVDMPEPNAFAIPGGYVYVTRGLLVLANSEDELAAVTGHEVAHVAGRHSVQRISRQGPFAVVFGIVGGVIGMVSPMVKDIIGGVGGLTQSLIFAPYSRSQETEADRVGQDISARAGWDPAALSTFLNTLERQVALTTKGSRRPSFFDSHPATPDRVAKTAEHAKQLTRASRQPISSSRENFLTRLNGMVVGQRAANGIVEGQRYLHPDYNFAVQFPEKWQIENSPRKVFAVAPEGAAAVVLGVTGQGNDPLDGARAIEKVTNSSGIASRAQTVTIGGLPAARTQVEADGRVKLDLTWIAYGGLIYQVVGIARTNQFESIQSIFVDVAQSFRSLSMSERAGIKEKRIRLVKAKGGETVDALASRSGSAWSAEELAVANELDAASPLNEGQVIKIAVAEPYTPRSLPKDEQDLNRTLQRTLPRR